MPRVSSLGEASRGSATVSQEPKRRQLTRPFHEKEQSVVVMDFCLFLLASTAPSPQRVCRRNRVGVTRGGPEVAMHHAACSTTRAGAARLNGRSVQEVRKVVRMPAFKANATNGPPARKARAIDAIVRARPPARKVGSTWANEQERRGGSTRWSLK
jgi:hypothetical protein